jgi:hypothetical protein
MKRLFFYFLMTFRQLNLRPNNLIFTFFSYMTIIKKKIIFFNNFKAIKILKFLYRLILILNIFLFLGVFLQYNEIFFPFFGLDNLLNLYYQYIIEIKEYLYNKITKIFNIKFLEENNSLSQLNKDTTIISEDINNGSTDSISKNHSILEGNKPKTYFYSSPYFYLPAILTGAVFIYLGSDNIISVISEIFSLFKGNGGGGPINPDWTPPTFPLYDPFPELEREMDLLAALNEQID